MNSALINPAFWRLYFAREAEVISDREIELQLREIARDFVVRTETIRFRHDGLDRTSQRRVIEFPLPCGGGTDLLVEYEPDPQGCTTTLFLHDASSDRKQQMGWWDLARWHPYCLHPEELDLLLNYWARGASPWPDQRTALLLLAPFVGLCDQLTQQSLSARVDAAYRALCPKALNDPPHLCEIPEADYRWDQDDHLGWVFSGNYPCYSTRNRSHVGGDEGEFPFSWFREVISRIRLSS